MRKFLSLLCALLALCLPALAESGWTWVEEPLPAPADMLRLEGISIGIDPGHQAHQNSEMEAVAPGSSA